MAKAKPKPSSKKFNAWPSGNRKRVVKGLFAGADKRDHPMQPAVKRALKEAYSGQPRKTGAPYSKPTGLTPQGS